MERLLLLCQLRRKSEVHELLLLPPPPGRTKGNAEWRGQLWRWRCGLPRQHREAGGIFRTQVYRRHRRSFCGRVRPLERKRSQPLNERFATYDEHPWHRVGLLRYESRRSCPSAQAARGSFRFRVVSANLWRCERFNRDWQRQAEWQCRRMKEQRGRAS